MALPKPRNDFGRRLHPTGIDLTIPQREHLEKSHAFLHLLVAVDVLHDGLGLAILCDDQGLRLVRERAE